MERGRRTVVDFEDDSSDVVDEGYVGIALPEDITVR